MEKKHKKTIDIKCAHLPLIESAYFLRNASLSVTTQCYGDVIQGARTISSIINSRNVNCCERDRSVININRDPKSISVLPTADCNYLGI